MAHSKREVWEAAKVLGLDDFISAVSRAFPDAIEGVAVAGKGVGVMTTDDRLLRACVRVGPGVISRPDLWGNKGNLNYEAAQKENAGAPRPTPDGIKKPS